MAQHDYVLNDAAGAAFRADINAALAAIASSNSGATEPAPTFAYQIWADTTANLLKIRNAANNAWITIGSLGTTNLGLAAAGAIGSSGLTQATARLLGRTTAGTGAPEEISVGAGLSLSGGQLSASGASAFPSGTRMSFQQTAAPTGWTKDTTAALDDSIMRIVTGTVGSGGSTAFSTFNGQTTVGATTLSAAQSGVPAHSHALNLSTGNLTGGSNTVNQTNPVTALNSANNTAASAASSHNHTITTSIKYYDFIIASKD